MNPYLSIVIPVKDRADELPQLVLSLDARLHKAKLSSEIVVISDGSTDGTAEALGSMARTVKTLKVVGKRTPSGKSDSLRQGMLIARGKVRAYGSLDAWRACDDFETFLGPLRGGAAVAAGVSHPALTLRSEIGAFAGAAARRGGGFFVRKVLLPDVRYVSWDIVAFSSAAAETAFGSIVSERDVSDLELLSRASRAGYEIREVSLPWDLPSRARPHLRHPIAACIEALRLRLGS